MRRRGRELPCCRAKARDAPPFSSPICLPTGTPHGNSDSPVRTEPGVVAAVRELVRFESKLGLNGDLVLPALANAYLVEDDAAAERLASAYPDCHFLTATGAHYHHRMVSGGKGSSAGPLALRRDFRELERRTAELETQIKVQRGGSGRSRGAGETPGRATEESDRQQDGSGEESRGCRREASPDARDLRSHAPAT